MLKRGATCLSCAPSLVARNPWRRSFAAASQWHVSCGGGSAAIAFFSTRRCAAATTANYTFDDFLNEDDDATCQPTGGDKVTTSSSAAATAASARVTAAAERSRAPHSLSEFIVCCTELLADAKRSGAGDTSRRERVVAFWRSHVARTIEMSVRNGHDLACVARAGRGYGLTIPPSAGAHARGNSNSAVYVGWTVLSRYESVTGCGDLMSSLALLVRSQPPIPASSSSSVSSGAATADGVRALHASHQKFALRRIRYFFGELDTIATSSPSPSPSPSPTAAASPATTPRIRCPRSDYESLCEALAVLDAFTATGSSGGRNHNSSSSSSIVGATRGGSPANAAAAVSWPTPPFHVVAKLWQLVGAVHRHAAPQCCLAMRFSHLVQCLSEMKRLCARCDGQLARQLAARRQLHQQNQQRFATGEAAAVEGAAPGGGDDAAAPAAAAAAAAAAAVTTTAAAAVTITAVSAVAPPSDATSGPGTQKMITALRNAAADIRVGATAVLDAIVAQAATLDKFVNSFHFTEVAYACEAMGLMTPAVLRTLRQTFHARTVRRGGGGGAVVAAAARGAGGGAGGGGALPAAVAAPRTIMWEFSPAVDARLRVILQIVTGQQSPPPVGL